MVAQLFLQRLPAHEGLHRPGEREAENERPQSFPEHEEALFEAPPAGVDPADACEQDGALDHAVLGRAGRALPVITKAVYVAPREPDSWPSAPPPEATAGGGRLSGGRLSGGVLPDRAVAHADPAVGEAGHVLVVGGDHDRDPGAGP